MRESSSQTFSKCVHGLHAGKKIRRNASPLQARSGKLTDAYGKEERTLWKIKETHPLSSFTNHVRQEHFKAASRREEVRKFHRAL